MNIVSIYNDNTINTGDLVTITSNFDKSMYLIFCKGNIVRIKGKCTKGDTCTKIAKNRKDINKRFKLYTDSIHNICGCFYDYKKYKG